MSFRENWEEVRILHRQIDKWSGMQDEHIRYLPQALIYLTIVPTAQLLDMPPGEADFFLKIIKQALVLLGGLSAAGTAATGIAVYGFSRLRLYHLKTRLRVLQQVRDDD